MRRSCSLDALALFSCAVALGGIASCVGDAPAPPLVAISAEAGSDGGGLPDAARPDASADATTDTGADAPAAFNPGKVPGLVLWLDAQDDSKFTTASGTVATWRDSSSAGNDAKALAVAGSAPSRTLSAALSKQVVHFAGQNQALAVSGNASLYFQAVGDFVVAVVASYTHAGVGGFVSKIEFPGTGHGLLLFTVADGRVCFTVTASCGDFPVSTGTFHRYISRRTAAGLELRTSVDGVEVPVRMLAAPEDVSVPTHDLLIGADRATTTAVTEGMIGDIAEVLIYHPGAPDAGLAAMDLQAIDLYLKTKWGL